MADKVVGGTPRGVESLCSTCRCAHRIIGLNLQTVVYCSALPRSPRMAFPVSECSLYDDQRLPSLEAMKQIAWEVKSRNRGKAGFVPDSRKLDVVITPPSRNGPPDQPSTTEGES